MRSLVVFLLFACVTAVQAHPVAQGRMEIEARDGKLAVRAEVSEEEVVVGTTLGRGPGTGTDNPWRGYADYLLAHVRFSAGGAALPGKVVSAERLSAPNGSAMEGKAVYRLEFDLPSNARELSVEQDCLNEILYAPGNPWTASYVLRVALPGRTAEDGRLLEPKKPLLFAWDPGAASPSPGPAEVSASRVWREYFLHGVHHILAGWDHLLFISALALAAVTFWDLVKVVTAFTLAHTLTLVLSVLNVVRLPSKFVEPMIALSIVFVALQNVFLPRTSRGWTRLAAAFAFGLFHGLGFAGGLLEAMEQLPGTAVVSALAAFSLGVEAGHQVVVIPVFLLALAARRWGAEWGRVAMLRWGSALVTVAGIYYVLASLRGA